MLSQVMELQDKSQRQVKEKTYNVVYDANLYEYLTSDEELIYGTTTYTIHSQSVPDRFNGDWQAFMNFARKNRGWANKIEAANEVIT